MVIKNDGLSKDILEWDRFIRLVSLLEILKTYAYDFAELSGKLASFSLLVGGFVENDQDFDVANQPELQSELENWLIRAEGLCEALNLRSAKDAIYELRTEKPWVGRPFAFALKQAYAQIERDLKHIKLLLIPLSKISFYDSPIFGEDVEARFKDAVNDIREAGSCYALGCSTAVVHHCMGIVQIGLAELGKHLNISINIHVDDWNSMITKIEGAVKRLKKEAEEGPTTTAQTKIEWRKVEPFYNEIIIDVRRIRDAWRNPDAHFRQPFDEPKAKKVLDVVGEFMQNLSNNLFKLD